MCTTPYLLWTHSIFVLRILYWAHLSLLWISRALSAISTSTVSCFWNNVVIHVYSIKWMSSFRTNCKILSRKKKYMLWTVGNTLKFEHIFFTQMFCVTCLCSFLNKNYEMQKSFIGCFLASSHFCVPLAFFSLLLFLFSCYSLTFTPFSFLFFFEWSKHCIAA